VGYVFCQLVPSIFWIDREVHIGRMFGVERTIEEKKMAREDCLLHLKTFLLLGSGVYFS
jgi:hypothetical protein